MPEVVLVDAMLVEVEGQILNDALHLVLIIDDMDDIEYVCLYYDVQLDDDEGVDAVTEGLEDVVDEVDEVIWETEEMLVLTEVDEGEVELVLNADDAENEVLLLFIIRLPADIT